MGNWSDAPLEILVLISEKLKLIEDFVAFRGVCSGWRSASPKEKFTGISQLSCIVYARKVVPLSNVAMHHLHHRPPPPPTRSRGRGRYRYYFKPSYFASKGWLFGINRHGDTCLFHPFSGARMSLPHACTLPECEERDLIVEAVLSFSPSFASNYALILRLAEYSSTGLAFWRPGKDVFTEIDNYKPALQWYSITCCKNGQLYALDLAGTIVIWDTNAVDVPIVQLVMKSPSLYYRSLQIEPWLILLAESTDGQVFIVARTTHNIKDMLVVHRIDANNNKCVQVNNLGGRALFFGVRARVCFFIEPSEIPVCMPNHIYLDEKRVYYKEYLPEYQDGGDHLSKPVPGIYSFPDGPLAPFKRKRHHS
ncbi:hypothetical protein CQW23_25593 [Capsicum baccatum]|uniref:KIB1-4 beta-propeller domain-containing protein n=1 Tax=Capsicum baccatum TaxID=33114 RepID=A0A2G2VLF5_CAPBA|nr:hypothetical protein CQW23_25593 [Capsicum baccatum]